jgi:hypothetical protein
LEVSSMVTVSSPSLTSQHSFPCIFPLPTHLQALEGRVGQRQTSQRHPATQKIYEYDYIRQINTRRPRSRLLTLLCGRAAEYSGTGQGVYGGMSLTILLSLSMISSLSTSSPGIRDMSSSLVY